MDSIDRLYLNITLIAVIGVLLRIITLYYPSYDSRDFYCKLLPYTITALFFFAALLNPQGSLCRKGDMIIGCICFVISIIISVIYNVLSSINWMN